MSGILVLKCFLVIIVFLFLAVYSSGYYGDLHSNYVPDTVPAGDMTKVLQGIIYGTSILGFIWNFIGFGFVATITSAPVYLFVSCVEFLIGTLLLVPLGLQSTSLPHTFSGCSDAAILGLSDAGNETNLFRFMAGLNGDVPEYVCRSFLTGWIIGLVLGSISALSGYWALRCAQNSQEGEDGQRPPGIDVMGWFIGLVPRFLSARVNFIMLWLKKWHRRRSTPKTFETASMEMMILTPNPPEHRPPYKYQQKTNPKLLELLSSYPIVTAIAEGLHYVDLIQLSLVSKDVHETIFPRSKPASNSSLKKHCCLQGANAVCWCCETQTCWSGPVSAMVQSSEEFCANFKEIGGAGTTWHLDNCRQYCSKCFRTRMCRSAGRRELSPKCNCYDNTVTFERQLCRFCIILPDKVAQERVEKREHEEMAVKAAQQVNCGGCSRRLPKRGPRWWACGRCKKECRSQFHPQWAGVAEV